MTPRHDTPGKHPSKGPQPGSVRLQDYLLRRWPKAYTLGVFNPASKTDGGNLSLHSEGRAGDVGIPSADRGQGGFGQQIFLWMFASREQLELQELIYNYQIWTARRDSEGVRPYTANPHVDHVHWGQNWNGAKTWMPRKEDEGEGDMPAPRDIVDALVTPEGSWKLESQGGILTERGNFYGSYLSLPAKDRQGSRRFVAITERRDGANRGYTLWGNDGSYYDFGPK